MQQNLFFSYASTTQNLALSLTSLMSNLLSVSEQNMNNKNDHSKTKFTNKVSVKKVAELGRLGPDIPLDKVCIFFFIYSRIVSEKLFSLVNVI